MPTRNVVLTDQQTELVDQLVKSGRYQNASEVLRDGLRLVQRRENEDAVKLEALRGALDEAEAAKHALGFGQGPIVLPIFVKLSLLSQTKTVEQIILESFGSYKISELEAEAAVVRLINGNSPDDTPIHSILFLMDGLNELPSQDDTRQELNRFIRQYPQHRFVLTCRAQDYGTLQGFRTAML